MAEEQRSLYITKNWILFIFIYYLILFGIGLFVAIQVLIDTLEYPLAIFQRSILGSVSISLSAASAAYIRKLYKLCFRYETSQETVDQLFLKRLGTIVYFLARPLFAMLFGLLVVIGIYSGLIITTVDREFGEGYLYISMALSFYAGFSSGNFIKMLERNGIKKLDGVV